MQPSKDDWVPSSNPLNIYCMRNVPNGTESVTDDVILVDDCLTGTLGWVSFY